MRERVIDHPLGYEALDQLLKETEEPHRPWMYSGDYRGMGMGQLTSRDPKDDGADEKEEILSVKDSQGHCWGWEIFPQSVYVGQNKTMNAMSMCNSSQGQGLLLGQCLPAVTHTSLPVGS